MRKRIFSTIAGILVAVGLTGCSTTYTVKDDTAKNIKTYGLVIGNFEVLGNNHPFPPATQVGVAEWIRKDIIEQLRENGLQVKAVPAEEYTELLARYAQFPRGRAGIKDTGSRNVGDGRDMFSRSGIEGLIVVAGNTNINRSSFIGKTGELATNLLAGVITQNYVGGGGGPDAVTTLEMSVITPDGRIIHHFGDYFTYKKGTFTLNKGDILDPKQRQAILQTYVNKYKTDAGL